MEFLKDYNFEIKYHLGKANIVADVLSRKMMHVARMMIQEYRLVETFLDTQRKPPQMIFYNVYFTVITNEF